MFRIQLARILVAFVALCTPVILAAASPYSDVERFVDARTVAVIRIDLKRLDVKESLRTVGDLVPSGTIAKEDVESASRDVADLVSALTQNDMNQALVVIGIGTEHPTAYSVIPLSKTKPSDSAIKGVADKLGKIVPANEFRMVGSAFVIAKPAVLEQVSTMRATARPDLARAWENASDSTIQLFLSMSDDDRRVLRELAPPLPKELGGGSPRILAEGLQWITIAIDTPPKLRLTMTMKANDAQYAAAVREFLNSVAGAVANDRDFQQVVPNIKALTDSLIPEAKGDRLVLTLTEDNGGAKKLMDDVIRPMVETTFTMAGRARSINNLKQIIIAMHNYHDTFGSLPPQASRSPDGKPLLSWRVHILPFVDQAELYGKFNLDEPWDSDHNRKLVERMPDIYASPRIAGGVAKKGMTTYLAPVGEKTIWGSEKGTNFAKITDGTSNTIAIVEAHPDRAVIWTKPGDLQFDAKDPGQALIGVWPRQNSFIAALCDGSVQTVPQSTPAETLLHYFQMNDGFALGSTGVAK